MRLNEFATPAPASNPERFTTWEQDVGYKLAELASVIAQMLLEREADGRVNPETRNEGGELFAQLIPLKLYIKDDFDAIARKHAIEALVAHVAAPPNPMPPDETAISNLVDTALRLLANFIKEKLMN
jgi:hypothetical protein